MVDKNEFIERSILPALGEFAHDYDIEGIADAVGIYSPRFGWVLKPDLTDVEFWEAVEENDLNPITEEDIA